MSILNITNGMAMMKYLDENNIVLDGETVPFNEAMCEGSVSYPIFSDDFCHERALVHGVGVEEYYEMVIDNLGSFFDMEYDELHLFFDEDMFCQINLLTILAYLDKNEYDGRVALHIIDHKFNEINAVEIKVDGFNTIYKLVVENKRVPDVKLPDMIMDGILDYLAISGDNNVIDKCIDENPALTRDELLELLFSKFSKFGLGDAQLLKRIDERRDFST